MKRVLDDIQSGRFVRDWCWRTRSTRPRSRRRAQAAEHPIEEVGAKLRAMMPWIKNALVDKARN